MGRKIISGFVTLIVILLIIPESRGKGVYRGREFLIGGYDIPDIHVHFGSTTSFSFPRDFPYWDFSLRELIMKTVSQKPVPTTAEKTFPHKILREEENFPKFLFRGEVYFIQNGGWIFCREDCTDCESCVDIRNSVTPTFEWILKKTERKSERLQLVPHYDLQLTLLPQGEVNFENWEDFWFGSPYIYVTSNSQALTGFVEALNGGSKAGDEHSFGRTKAPSLKNQRDGETRPLSEKKEGENKEEKDMETPETNNNVFIDSTTTILTTEIQGKRNQRRIKADGDVGGVKNYSEPAETSSVSVPLFFPTNDETPEQIRKLENDQRLILGTDQFGEKHLVHIVPAGDINSQSAKTEELSAPGTVSLDKEFETLSLYNRMFRRVVNSLNTQKNAIQQFLFASDNESNRTLNNNTKTSDNNVLEVEKKQNRTGVVSSKDVVPTTTSERVINTSENSDGEKTDYQERVRISFNPASSARELVTYASSEDGKNNSGAYLRKELEKSSTRASDDDEDYTFYNYTTPQNSV